MTSNSEWVFVPRELSDHQLKRILDNFPDLPGYSGVTLNRIYEEAVAAVEQSAQSDEKNDIAASLAFAVNEFERTGVPPHILRAAFIAGAKWRGGQV